MNEINETFTKQINGFECSIKCFLSQSGSYYSSFLYKINKKNKGINIEIRNYPTCCGIAIPIIITDHTQKVIYSKKDAKTVYQFIENANGCEDIWQILQDEWRKRFGDE